jgi:hypothetical protein
MALKLEEKQWVQKEIKTHVDKHFEARAVFETGILENTRLFISKWGGAAVIVGILGVLIAALITLMIALNSRATTEATFQGTTTESLRDIDRRLTLIEASNRAKDAVTAPAKVLNELAHLTETQFAENLSALKAVTEQPANEVETTTSVLQDVAMKLQNTDVNADDYWPTVLRFIQFASSRYSSTAPAAGTPVNEYLSNIDGPNFPSRGVYQLQGGYVRNETFRDSRIIFTNNPVIFQNVRFINCVFEFPNDNNPPPYLRNAGRELLVAGIQTATIGSGM